MTINDVIRVECLGKEGHACKERPRKAGMQSSVVLSQETRNVWVSGFPSRLAKVANPKTTFQIPHDGLNRGGKAC